MTEATGICIVVAKFASRMFLLVIGLRGLVVTRLFCAASGRVRLPPSCPGLLRATRDSLTRRLQEAFLSALPAVWHLFGAVACRVLVGRGLLMTKARVDGRGWLMAKVHVARAQSCSLDLQGDRVGEAYRS